MLPIRITAPPCMSTHDVRHQPRWPQPIQTTAVASWSTLRLCEWQLVRQHRPLAFDHGSHFIRDVVDALDIEL
jgi:hypothetical protein